MQSHFAAVPAGFFLMVIGQSMAKKTMLALLPPFYRSADSRKRLHRTSISHTIPLQPSPTLCSPWHRQTWALLAQDLPSGAAAPVAAADAHSEGKILL